jgi:SAM-dependent methyltransferase
MKPDAMPLMILRTALSTSCFLVALLGSTPAAANASSQSVQSTDFYSQKRPSRDGIGKIYMGREISFVMGHQGIDWLERKEREREERTDLVVDGMRLASDSVVADIGAGSGHFTFRISPRVPQGRVLAVDIQPEMLSVIQQRSKQGHFLNVEAVQGSERDPNLEPASVDAVLMVDAYHEFS